MNDNTILRIKVPAHLYESVKEQLTLSEAKKGKHNLGAGMELVKEKKMKAPKDGMKKMEETKEELQELDPNVISTVAQKSYVGMHPDTAAVLDTVMQLGAAGLTSAGIIAILYANRNAIKSGGKKVAQKIVGTVKNAISAVKGGTPAPEGEPTVKEEKADLLTPDQEQAVLKQVLEASSEQVAEKKERTMEELKKAKDMLEMKMKKMEEASSPKEELNEASLELDWASGIPSLKAKCKKYSLTCKVVQEKGPAGGHPLVKIIGSKDNIVSFLKDGYADADQLEDYIADIKGNK